MPIRQTCAWCEPLHIIDPARDWAETYGRYVRLMAEICSSPVWVRDGTGVCVEELPVSDPLKRALVHWGDDYTEIGDMLAHDVLIYECSPAFPLAWYNARGAALAEALRHELGADWQVDYSSLGCHYCD